MAKQKSGSADSAKVSQQNIALRRVLSSPYSLALFAALAGAFFAWLFDFLPSVFPKSKGDPHTYSFVMNGRTISGRSTNPFEETGNYRARVETCEQGGIEKIFTVVSCYITIRPKVALTISNSRNPTTGVYDNGAFAQICCISFPGGADQALYRVEMPPGLVIRRTFPKDQDIQIQITLPAPDPNLSLDAISFSPGEGAPSVLFPIRGNLTGEIKPLEWAEERRHDPEVVALVEGMIKLREEMLSRQEINRGLTYPEK